MTHLARHPRAADSRPGPAARTHAVPGYSVSGYSVSGGE